MNIKSVASHTLYYIMHLTTLIAYLVFAFFCFKIDLWPGIAFCVITYSKLFFLLKKDFKRQKAETENFTVDPMPTVYPIPRK